ncbi:hypothetical protein Bca52824_000511 [Brassica carinata]|uniref:PPM-type phosphatase domain-containing protein n=1 Tax=Brassica carinata TaxID=52824 RepID=A0A8X7WGQ4_BRACI|nr:hypothetical protein Bca52824_000511 [Brassica carinata]
MAPETEVSPMVNNLETGDDNMTHLSSSGKPPRNLSAMRHCNSTAWLIDSEGEERFGAKSPEGQNSTWKPVFRSGSWSDKGPKRSMEDEFICVDDLKEHIGSSTGAFYGEPSEAFNGRQNFPSNTKKATRSAFVKTDHALADAPSLDRSSGTTALTALILDKTMLIANAGDSRAVLGKRGRAIELSKDHKPNCTSERLRIEKLGGVIYDGYLNGQLSVARALGDWHIKGTKGSLCPLSCEPELEEIVLAEEDEYLIMGCDGLWDVMSSQCAVTMVRRELMQHNDPEKCSQALVKEALQRNSCDNLTVVVVCFSLEPPPKIEIPKSHKRRSISAEGLDLLKGVLNDL